MKQPEDTRTLELAIDAKRGRGRPAKADALSQGERARRYREKQKAKGIKSDATENLSPIQANWRDMVHQLQNELAEAERANKVASQYNTSAYGEINALKATIRYLEKEKELLESERNAAFKRNTELEIKMKLCDASR